MIRVQNTKYIDDYQKENYDRITFKVPKGKKQELQGLAEDENVSLTQLIVSSVEDKYLIDLSGKRENR